MKLNRIWSRWLAIIRVARTDPDLAATRWKNATGRLVLINNHYKHVLKVLLIIPTCPGVVWHPKSDSLGLYSFLTPNLSKSCPYHIRYKGMLLWFWKECVTYCARLNFLLSRGILFIFLLKSSYIPPLYCKAKKQRWFGLEISPLRKNMWPWQVTCLYYNSSRTHIFSERRNFQPKPLFFCFKA